VDKACTQSPPRVTTKVTIPVEAHIAVDNGISYGKIDSRVKEKTMKIPTVEQLEARLKALEEKLGIKPTLYKYRLETLDGCVKEYTSQEPPPNTVEVEITGDFPSFNRYYDFKKFTTDTKGAYVSVYIERLHCLGGRNWTMSELLKPGLSLLVKLGRIAVHTEETLSPEGHAFDTVAINQLIDDPEVKTWIRGMKELLLYFYD
jgi:hypothetical protein